MEIVRLNHGKRRFYDGPRPALGSEKECGFLIRDPGYHAESPGDRCNRLIGHDGQHYGSSTFTTFAEVIPTSNGVEVATTDHHHGSLDVTFKKREDLDAFIQALNDSFQSFLANKEN